MAIKEKEAINVMDRETVMLWLEICGNDDCYAICPYRSRRPDCMYMLIANALSLLKAQEPRVMTPEEVLTWAETPAEKRNPIFFEQKKGKGPSGWICNSLCPKDYYLCCLGKEARCWTSQPTDEQRQAVKWE